MYQKGHILVPALKIIFSWGERKHGTTEDSRRLSNANGRQCYRSRLLCRAVREEAALGKAVSGRSLRTQAHSGGPWRGQGLGRQRKVGGVSGGGMAWTNPRRHGEDREQLDHRVEFMLKEERHEMSSHAKSQKFAVAVVQSDGAERAVWAEGDQGGPSVHRPVTRHTVMYVLTTLCSVPGATGTGVHVAVRDLISQNAEQLVLRQLPSKTKCHLLSIYLGASFPENQWMAEILVHALEIRTGPQLRQFHGHGV